MTSQEHTPWMLPRLKGYWLGRSLAALPDFLLARSPWCGRPRASCRYRSAPGRPDPREVVVAQGIDKTHARLPADLVQHFAGEDLGAEDRWHLFALELSDHPRDLSG